MKLNRYTPKNIHEASDFLQKHPQSHPIGGGSRTSSQKPEVLVEMSPLGLDYIDLFPSPIEKEGKELVLGATTPLSKIAESLPLKEFAQGILVQAAKKTLELSLSPQKATVGGEVGVGNPSSPFLATLLALGAVTRVYTEGHVRLYPLDTLYSPDGLFSLKQGEIVEEVQIPSRYSSGSTALELAENSHQKPLGVAMFLCAPQGVVQNIGIGGISLGPYPLRLDELEGMLQGSKAVPSSLDFPLEFLKREMVLIEPFDTEEGYFEVRRILGRAFEKCCRGFGEIRNS